MNSKHFIHQLRVAVSDFIQYQIDKNQNGYKPLDNLFFVIDYPALVKSELNYDRRSEKDSLEHFDKFRNQYIEKCIDIDYLLNHPNFNKLLTEYELREMIETEDNLNDIITEEIICLIKYRTQFEEKN